MADEAVAAAADKPAACRQTTPPGRHVVLFDGHCKFCQAQSRNLIALVPRGSIEVLSFQEPGVLERFPGVTWEACMQAMHLITPAGRVYRGCEAVVHALAARRSLCFVPYVYYVPGIRQLCDLLYALIGRYRYRILGKAIEAGECDSGTCALHQHRR